MAIGEFINADTGKIIGMREAFSGDTRFNVVHLSEALPKFEPPKGLTQVEIDALYHETFPNGLDQARREALSEYIGKHVHGLFEHFKHMVCNDQAMHSLRSKISNVLGMYRDEGLIPDDIPIGAVIVQHAGGGTLNVDLPMHLRVWLDMGIAMRTPKFAHDCEGCTFLANGHAIFDGVVRRYDFYHCGTQLHGWPTVIARYGNEGPEYLSGLEIARLCAPEEPLGVAFALAREKGLKVDR
jgi:hypothetical protein